MKIREIFAGNISTHGTVIQHQTQLFIASALWVIDLIWDKNKYKDFTFIIKVLAWMHILLILLKYFSTKLELNKFTTWRIIFNFIASVIQLTVIILSIRWYGNAFKLTTNEDGTVTDISSLPLGVWHMVNVY